MLQIPIASLNPEEALLHFQNPFFAKAFATDAPVSSAFTRKLLDWKPTHATLLADMETGDYLSPQSVSKFDNIAR